MNSLTIAFSVVFPLFLMMALGYFLKRVKLFTPAFLDQLNGLCFKVFLPILLFVNIYSSDFKQDFSPRLVLYALACNVAYFILLMVAVPQLEKDHRRQGALVQGMFRSNFILFGMSIVTSLYGPGNATSLVAILMAFVIPLFNCQAVMVLEVYGRNNKQAKAMVVGIVKNPLILASLLAFVFVLAGVRLPAPLVSTLSTLSNVATPLALMTLGGSFAFSRVQANTKALALGVAGKLVVMPLLVIPMAVWLGIKEEALAALFAMAATPPAVSSYIMARQMGSDDELAGQMVVVGSFLSVFTLFLGISLLLQLGLL